MRIQTTYHRQVPDTATGHKIVLTQVFSSMDKREIDNVEKILSKQYGSGVITEVEMTEYMFDTYYSEKVSNYDNRAENQKGKNRCGNDHDRVRE